MATEPYLPKHLAAIPEAARAAICAAAAVEAAKAPRLSPDTKEALRVLMRRPHPSGHPQPSRVAA